MEEILNPNCSEYVSRIGIKKSELPYIKKRIKDLGYEDESELLEEFSDYLDRQNLSEKLSGEMMEEGIAGDYIRIRDELLAKRLPSCCPFCKVEVKKLGEHLKEYHKEEVVGVYDNITEEEVSKMRKEVVYNNL